MVKNPWDPGFYDHRHGFVTQYGEAVLELLPDVRGLRVLDLGCGTGHLTAQIAARGATVVGIDSNPGMIESARTAYPTIEFFVADGQDFALAEPVDAVFTNAALHWMPNTAGVIQSVAGCLAPGGWFVGEFGGRGNVATIRRLFSEALRDEGATQIEMLWVFPSVGQFATQLESHGFQPEFLSLFSRPTVLPGADGLSAWLRSFGRAVKADVNESQFERAIAQTEADYPDRDPLTGEAIADYVRLRFRARRLPA